MQGSAQMSNPIFQPGDFEELRETLRRHLESVLPERDHRDLILGLVHSVKIDAWRLAQNKIESLGIDAETPEKLKFLELLQKPRHKSRREDACLYKRIAELEREITIAYESRDRAVLRANELERMIHELPEKVKRLEHLEKIATSLEGNALAYQRMDAEFELLKRNFNSLTNKREEERAEIAPLLERLAELEHVLKNSRDLVDNLYSASSKNQARVIELERMIAEGPIVYANCMRTFGDSDPYVFELDSDWSTEKSSQDTHRARLVQIEPIDPK